MSRSTRPIRTLAALTAFGAAALVAVGTPAVAGPSPTLFVGGGGPRRRRRQRRSSSSRGQGWSTTSTCAPCSTPRSMHRGRPTTAACPPSASASRVSHRGRGRRARCRPDPGHARARCATRATRSSPAGSASSSVGCTRWSKPSGPSCAAPPARSRSRRDRAPSPASTPTRSSRPCDATARPPPAEAARTRRRSPRWASVRGAALAAPSLTTRSASGWSPDAHRRASSLPRRRGCRAMPGTHPDPGSRPRSRRGSMPQDPRTCGG